MNQMQGILTSVFKMDSEKGKEIGGGFTYFCHEFNKFIELPEDKKPEIISPIISVMKKLGKVANAIDRYESLEEVKMNNLIRRVEEDKSSIHLIHQDSSVELEGAVEEVVSSSKAALDAAVKILRPLWGINLLTYGKAGDKVSSSLKNNVPVSLQPKVAKLITLIEKSEPWMRNLRNQRTKAEHQGISTVSPLSATIVKGKVEKKYPSVGEGMPAKEFINIVYNNIFCFLQDFVVLSLASKFYKGLAPIITNGESGTKRKFGVKIEKIMATCARICKK